MRCDVGLWLPVFPGTFNTLKQWFHVIKAARSWASRFLPRHLSFRYFNIFDISVIVGSLAADRPSCLASGCHWRRSWVSTSSSSLDLEHLNRPSAGDCDDLLAELVNIGPYFDNEACIPGNIFTGYLAGPHLLVLGGSVARIASFQLQFFLVPTIQSPHVHSLLFPFPSQLSPLSVMMRSPYCAYTIAQLFPISQLLISLMRRIEFVDLSA